MNATDANRAIAAEYANPLLREVSAKDSVGVPEELRIYGSSFPVAGSATELSSTVAVGGTAERI